MKKYLRINLVSVEPERGTAIEFLSDSYLRHEMEVPLDRITWRLETAVLIRELVKILRARNWHPTDIGDELDEARVASKKRKVP